MRQRLQQIKTAPLFKLRTPTPSDPLVVCCVCTLNTCRSPMLEFLLKHHLSKHPNIPVRVISAGVWDGAPNTPASANGVRALAELGIDISTHRAQSLSAINSSNVDLWLCMSEGHAEYVLEEGVDRRRIQIVSEMSGGVPDPIGGPFSEYKDCRDVLAREAEKFAKEIVNACTSET